MDRNADPSAYHDAREQRVRERFVAIEEAKMLREKLQACYRREGVNHYQNCRELADAYMKKVHSQEFGAVYAQKEEE